MKDNQPKTDSEIFTDVMKEAMCIAGGSLPTVRFSYAATAAEFPR